LDLTSGRSEVIPLVSDLVHDYVGGEGLRFRLFSQYRKPWDDPLFEDNLLVLGSLGDKLTTEDIPEIFNTPETEKNIPPQLR
jgi:hypothetical protein